MSAKELILGIDTSNYTTSVGIVNIDNEVIANIKFPLSVKAGERGLRQSDAVFAHVKNLPFAMEAAQSILSSGKIVAIGVSEKPRNQDGSYMPCFLAGVAAAKSVAVALGVPLYRFSHQCGHIMAAHHSSGVELLSGEFAAFHVSGGTTELVRVKASDTGFDTEIVGESSDLNAGQAVDRVGVMMGLSFPAGAKMERLALTNTKKIPQKHPSVKGTVASISGLENLAIKLYEETADKALVSAFVFDYVANTLKRMRDGYVEKYGRVPFLFSGGVMSNSIIKDKLREDGSYFSAPELSADNAVGIALLARRKYLSEND